MEKKEHPYPVGGNVNCFSHCGDALKKLGINLPYDPETLPVGIYSEKNIKKKQKKKHMYPSVHHSTVYNSQDMEGT